MIRSTQSWLICTDSEVHLRMQHRGLRQSKIVHNLSSLLPSSSRRCDQHSARDAYGARRRSAHRPCSPGLFARPSSASRYVVHDVVDAAPVLDRRFGFGVEHSEGRRDIHFEHEEMGCVCLGVETRGLKRLVSRAVATTRSPPARNRLVSARPRPVDAPRANTAVH